MSEVSETYHLYSGRQADGIALLERSALHGYVYPPHGPWVTILAEGSPFQLCKELIASNRQGLLLHIIYSQDHGWSCAFYEGPDCTASIQQAWDVEDSVSLSEGFVDKVSAILQLSSEQQRQLTRIAAIAASGPIPGPLMGEFAQAIRLELERNESYENLSEVYDQERPEFAKIREVMPDRTKGFAEKIRAGHQDRPEYMFPRVLFGDQASTRRAIRKMVQQAWDQGSWQPVLEKLEFVYPAEATGEIYIGACSMYVRPQAHTWRLYDFNEALLRTSRGLKTSATPQEMRARYHDLLLGGMNYLWFALGLLNTELLQLTRGHDGDYYEEVCREMLVAYVRWLPEMLVLAPRLRTIMSYISTNSDVWSGNLGHVAAIAGWRFDCDVFQKQFAGSKVKYLLHDKVIEAEGDRYKVSARFLAGS